jgi:signal transduction histidine kinase
MAAAGSQTQRQGIVDRLNDRLAELASVLGRIDQAAIDPEQLRDVRSQLDALATNLKALDEFVRQRIYADDAFETVMARLPVLAARVREVADEALVAEGGGEPRPDSAVAATDRPRLIAWSAAGLEGVTLMLATPAVHTVSRLERVKSELQTLVTRMDGLREQLPPQVRLKIDGLHDNIAQFGLGDQSIFQARRVQIEAGTAIQTSQQLIDQSIDKFVASVSVILKATQQEISGRSAQFIQTVSWFNLLIFGTSTLCVVAGAAIFAYVRHAVIRRLKDVQEYMGAQVEGRPATMSTEGADEIAEIAKATEVFVTRIADREGVLRERTRELSEALGQQTATGEILRGIIASPDDSRPVFEAILANVLTLCEATAGAMFLFDVERLHLVACDNYPAAECEELERVFPLTPHRGSLVCRSILDHSVINVADLPAEPGYTLSEVMKKLGPRASLAVPMMRDSEPVGVIALHRAAAGLFPEPQVEMVKTFADQAIIALGHVRLFEELREAKEKAEAALRGLRTAQASLIQAEKMASLGQLTAGIAHEIKNPLNFVNNFADLSVELLDELKETSAPAIAGLAEDERAEVDELVETLTGNLEKIAEHGRRADGIVKSMLEHSRGVTGERREVDLNNLVEGALNLAYHGARAQDQNFNIILERDFDHAIAPIELVPQDITRVCLNLFGNGYYAATKRRRDGAEPDFRPVLKVTTHDLGEAVEIRVRDNGIGIPPEIREKLFQPFFTTKPTGEGTGLGLSISWDIVTQQHGGTIGVDSRVGEFTEFTVRLPRTHEATIVQATTIEAAA